MASQPIPKDEEFDCGCKVTCRVVEGENTITLESCDDSTCPVREIFIEEAQAQPQKDLVFGRKDIVQ